VTPAEAVYRAFEGSPEAGRRRRWPGDGGA
jgi:hypothetical protein